MLTSIRRRDDQAVARLGRPDRDPLLRAEMDRRWLLVEVDRLRAAPSQDKHDLRDTQDSPDPRPGHQGAGTAHPATPFTLVANVLADHEFIEGDGARGPSCMCGHIYHNPNASTGYSHPQHQADALIGALSGPLAAAVGDLVGNPHLVEEAQMNAILTHTVSAHTDRSQQ